MSKVDPAKKPIMRNIAQRKWISGDLGSSFPTLEELKEKIGEDLYEDHAKRLQPFKDLVLMAEDLCPLEMSYDVSRVQHPYFLEFTWTTMLGGIYISPQSGWVAALLAEQAALDRKAKPFIPDLGDKYKLEAAPTMKEGAEAVYPHVVFSPGTNAFKTTVDTARLVTVLRDHPDAVIKPHPLTDPGLIREMGREFGYHRILNPKASGIDLLKQCEVAYVAGSEIGLAGHLIGKTVVDIGNVLREARMGLGPVFHAIRKVPGSLPRVLGSDFGGFFRPDDPNLARRMERYFANAMRVREGFNPPIRELSHTEYADFLSGKFTYAP